MTEQAIATRVVRPRVLGAMLAIPVAALALGTLVREVSRIEKTLAAEGETAVRVVVYEMVPGDDLRILVEPTSEVLRVVVHAVRRGGELSPMPHATELRTAWTTESGDAQSETFHLEVPGARTRVTPEEPELSVGDPTGFDVSVARRGASEVTVNLASLADADALLVRVYRRDAVNGEELARRARAVPPELRAHMAELSWEPDFADLDTPEQRAILGARWRKMPAARGSRPTRTHAIALSAPPPPPPPSSRENLLGFLEVRKDESAAVLVQRAAKVHVAADDPSVTIAATIRRTSGETARTEGRGELEIAVPPDATFPMGAELSASSQTVLTFRSPDPTAVEWLSHVPAWRVTPVRPMTVSADDEPLVLDVAARLPAGRAPSAPLPLDIDVALRGEGVTLDSRVSGELPRSAFDRFDGPAGEEVPSERKSFCLVVPPHAVATLATRLPRVDFTLKELDPKAVPYPAASRPATAALPVTRLAGEMEWNGFLPRRPTNAAAFESENDPGKVELRIARRLLPLPAPALTPYLIRVTRARATETKTIEGKVFDRAGGPLSFQVSGKLVVLPIHLFSEEPMDVVATVDGGRPERRPGLCTRATVSRVFSVKGDTRAVMVLGDDLRPGRHTLTFTGPAGKRPFVHAPWASTPKVLGPRWIAGDYDE
jgi:hypothetical protein